MARTTHQRVAAARRRSAPAILGVACLGLVACGETGTPAPTTAVTSAAPAVANGPIVVSGKRAADAGLYFMQSDGTGLTFIPNTVADDVTPSISRDGRIIVFSDKDAAVTTINVDGTGRKVIATGHNEATGSPGRDLPIISPDGTKVAYLQDHDPGHTHDIYVANIDGTNPKMVQALTETDETTIHPSFSPTGTEIVYEDIVAPDTAQGIFTVKIDGTLRQKVGMLPAGASADVQPSWSPDGQRVAFSEKLGELHGIFVEKLDGSGRQRVSGPAPADDTQPSWSQDSQKLVYEMKGGAIGISGVDGSNPTKLALTGEFHAPRWAAGS
jgi:TolB protein